MAGLTPLAQDGLAPFPSWSRQPFDLYVHAPLTVQDVLVFRIMREVMHPTKFKPRVLDRPVHSVQTFAQIRAQDIDLGADLQVLRKLLSTKMASEIMIRSSLHMWDYCTLGDQIMDLVQRHYLETHDYTFRSWIEAVQPTRGLIDLPKTPADPAYRMQVLKEQRDQGKTLDTWHLARARQLQKAIEASQSDQRLYDGGTIVALLRRSLDKYMIYQAKPWCRIEEKMRERPVIPVSPEFDDLRLHLMVRPSKVLQPVYGSDYLSRDSGDFAQTDASIPAAAAAAAAAERGRTTIRSGSWRRTASEPDVKAFGAAALQGRFRNNPYHIVFPKASLQYVVRLSRSRSLSPARLADMFVTGRRRTAPYYRGGGGEADGMVDAIAITPPPPLPCSASAAGQVSTISSPTPAPEPQNIAQRLYETSDSSLIPVMVASPAPPAVETETTLTMRFCVGCCMYHGVSSQAAAAHHPPCDNCARTTHRTADCASRCGFCGAPNPRLALWAGISDDAEPGRHSNPHSAPQCPVSKAKRCKCVPFPQFHTADNCPIVCSRACGNPATLGSPKHRNAMTCRSRCCMCGIRGSHSGKECRLRTCRCKGKHLGQDCCWNPTCRVPGCDRFLCGLHCRGCGSAEKPFVDWRCRRCLRDKDDEDGERGEDVGDGDGDSGGDGGTAAAA